MRPPSSLLTFLFNPPLIIRIAPLAATTTAAAYARHPSYPLHSNPIFQIPSLSYPTCVRNFTSAAPTKQDFQTIMSGIQKEQHESEQMAEVERLNEPAGAKEAEILQPEVVKEEICKEKQKKEEVNGSSAVASAKGETAQKKQAVEEKEKLPKLSAADFKAYNRMAEHMEYFHNHFRSSWNLLYTACKTNTRPKHLSLKSFIATGLQFLSHLETHHSIEEAHIFPVLARRMPEFRNGKGNGAAELLRQHREIHKGMEGMQDYLERCRAGEVEFELGVLRAVMERDGWGDVLWRHLDEEVATLGAENMRRYWSLEEMRRMPM